MTKQETRPEKPLKKKITNKIGMEFIFVPGGEFIMGTDDLIENHHDLEAVKQAADAAEAVEGFSRYDFQPKHKVSVGPFYMSRYPVTQAQWTRVMGNNKASNKGGWDLPMETVSWRDCLKFIDKINDMMETDAHRLPTEAEWEFCCRAGSTGDYCFEGRANRLDYYAWYSPNTGFRPRAVGQKKPNKYGLFDMHGSVWEWTSSKEAAYPYRSDDGRENPEGPEARIVRGGSYLSDEFFCRCGFRDWHLPVHRDHDIGFRLAVS